MTEKGCDLTLIDIQCDPIHGLDHLFVTSLNFERFPDIVNPTEHKITKLSEMYVSEWAKYDYDHFCKENCPLRV